MDELRILSPTAILGYGFPEDSFYTAMKEKPHVIGVDAGSTDPGPYYLGEGVPFVSAQATKRDLTFMIKAAIENKIPLIIGTGGGSGARPHVTWTETIIREIAREQGLSFVLATIYADIARETVIQAYQEDRFTACTPGVAIHEDMLARTNYFVAQMGVEPIVEALGHADVILAGRCYDPAVFAALPIKLGYDKGLAIHLGKILECACIAATPGSGSDCMMGYLREDSFTVRPVSSKRRCSELSVAAHTLYEKSDPYILPGPGGRLNLTQTSFKAVSDAAVRVSGSKYETAPYSLKIEGAACTGFRTISIAGIRDPIMIGQLPDIIEQVSAHTSANFGETIPTYHLNVRCYGIDGVMGKMEPEREQKPKEVGIVIEVVAESQEDADTVCGFVRSTMLHFGYEGRIATAGNLAFPFSPSDFQGNKVYEFSIYHVMEVADPLQFFPIHYQEVKGDN